MKIFFSLLLIIITFFTLSGVCYVADAPAQELNVTVKEHSAEHNKQPTTTQDDIGGNSYGFFILTIFIVLLNVAIAICIIAIGRNFGLLRLKRKTKEVVLKSNKKLGIALLIMLGIGLFLSVWFVGSVVLIGAGMMLGLGYGVFSYFSPAKRLIDEIG